MNSEDEIVDEVRQNRDAFAAECHYDLEEMYRKLKDREDASGKKAADLRAITVHTGTA